MEHYNQGLLDMKMNRNSIVKIDMNQERLKQINYHQLDTERAKAMNKYRKTSKQEKMLMDFGDGSDRMNKTMKDARILKDNVHGSPYDIEKETLKILRTNRKRFNRGTEDRNEFIASNYLANILASEELTARKVFNKKFKQSQIIKGKEI